jgi:hypothetical protein
MSYTQSSATATCTVAGVDNAQAAALLVYDYLVANPDEIPDSLDYDDIDSDDAVEQIETYLSIADGKLTIHLDSESDSQNHDSSIFDLLCDFFAERQTSLYMTVNWVTNDSYRGISAGAHYYDQRGELIDVDNLLTAALSS